MSLTSLQNNKVKQAKTLLSDPHYRKETGLFVLETVCPIQELVKNAPHKIRFVLTRSLTEFTFLSPIPNKTFEVPSKLLTTISSLKTSPGLIAVCEQPNWDTHALLHTQATYVICDQISNPQNMGAIIRNAAAFNCRAVFYTPGSVDIYHPVCISSMSGALPHQAVIPLSEPILAQLIDLKSSFFSFANKQEAIPLNKITRKPAVSVLILGSESHGIQTETLLNVRPMQSIKIQINPQIDSLNVAVSSGIGLNWFERIPYEA